MKRKNLKSQDFQLYDDDDDDDDDDYAADAVTIDEM